MVCSDHPALNKAAMRSTLFSPVSEFSSSTSWGGSCCPRAVLRDIGSILGGVLWY
jgi:hypothetical protein